MTRYVLFFRIKELRKNTIIAEKTPVGNPMKIEKKIFVERSSVTRMVTMINEMIAKNREMIRFIF